MINTLHSYKFYKGRILRPGTCKGYLFVALKVGGVQKLYQVHTLVAKHFLGYSKRRPEVNHKDFNTRNNRLNNLEWVTSKENKRHARGRKALAL